MGSIREGSAEFTVKDGQISGIVEAMGMKKQIQNPKLDGHSFEFFIKGKGMKLVFTGTFDEQFDHFSGTIKGPLSMEFEGEKV